MTELRSLKAMGTQRRIFEAALECFADDGYEGSSLADIRRKAKVSVGSLYHWFPSKEALAAKLYLDGLRDYQAGVFKILEREASAESGIRSMVSHHLTWVEQHPKWARHLLITRQAEFLGTAREEIRRLNLSLFRALEAWHRPFVESRALEDIPLELFVGIVMGPAQEFVRQWLTGRSRTSMTVARRILAESTWRAVRRPPRPSLTKSQPSRRDG